MEIPVIDLETQSEAECLRLIDKACRDTGFFVLKGHGVPAALLDQTFAEARRFFRMPAEEKMASWNDHKVADRGYFPMGLQALDSGTPPDLSEFVMLGLDLPEEHPMVQAGTPMYGPNPWPSGMPGWKETMQAYYEETLSLGKRMLGMIATNLGEAEDFFEPMAQLPIVTLKLSWYPPRPADAVEGQHGAGAHTDWGAVTFVAGDGTPGLQVQSADGDWLDVPAIEGSFIVNIGDMLQRWTNDKYRSGPHRVLSNNGQERFSLVTFYDMDYHAELKCIDSCISVETPALYEPMLAGEYLMSRYEESISLETN